MSGLFQGNDFSSMINAFSSEMHKIGASSALVSEYSDILKFYTLLPESLATVDSEYWTNYEEITTEAWFKSFTKVYTNTAFLAFATEYPAALASAVSDGKFGTYAEALGTVLDQGLSITDSVSDIAISTSVEASSIGSAAAVTSSDASSEETEASSKAVTAKKSSTSTASTTTDESSSESGSDSASSGNLAAMLTPPLGAVGLLLLSL
ncbi:hypothetical protein CANTEDRAFT_116438, partial [Yamadazyma tenuis ATCC 10573]